MYVDTYLYPVFSFCFYVPSALSLTVTLVRGSILFTMFTYNQPSLLLYMIFICNQPSSLYASCSQQYNFLIVVLHNNCMQESVPYLIFSVLNLCLACSFCLVCFLFVCFVPFLIVVFLIPLYHSSSQKQPFSLKYAVLGI